MEGRQDTIRGWVGLLPLLMGHSLHIGMAIKGHHLSNTTRMPDQGLLFKDHRTISKMVPFIHIQATLDLTPHKGLLWAPLLGSLVLHLMVVVSRHLAGPLVRSLFNSQGLHLVRSWEHLRFQISPLQDPAHTASHQDGSQAEVRHQPLNGDRVHLGNQRHFSHRPDLHQFRPIHICQACGNASTI